MGIFDIFRRRHKFEEAREVITPKLETKKEYFTPKDKENYQLMIQYSRMKILNDRIKAEEIYNNDYLLQSLIHRIATTVAEARWWLEGGDDKIRETINDWLEHSPYPFNDMVYYIVKDNLIYGTSIWMWQDMYLMPINPKYIDFKRSKMRPEVDKYGYPIAYRWYGIDGVRDYPAEKFVVFSIWDDAPSKWATPPLALFYDVAVQRLKIDRLIGESSYRNASPVIVEKVGNDTFIPSEEVLENRVKFWKEMKGDVVKAIVIPYYYDIDSLPTGDYESILRGGEYLISLLNILFGYPISLIFPIRTVRAVLDAQLDEYYRWLEMIRNRIVRKFRINVFKPILKIKKNGEIVTPTLEEIPDIKFEPLRLDLVKARILAVLGRAGLLTQDEEIEEEIRRTYNLPSKEPEEKEEIE